jgi:hypothetical protein
MAHMTSTFARPAAGKPLTERKRRLRADHRASLRTSALTIIALSVMLWVGVIELARHLPI